jgi:hypothetical protein
MYVEKLCKRESVVAVMMLFQTSCQFSLANFRSNDKKDSLNFVTIGRYNSRTPFFTGILFVGKKGVLE